MEKKRVLVLEPNAFHGEVIPGIVFYFQELGYLVDVYVRKPHIEEKLFYNVEINGKLVEYDIENINKILLEEEIKDYDFLFLTSLEIQKEKQIIRLLDLINGSINTKYGILGIYHTSSFIDRFNDYEMAKEGRIFFLSDFQTNKYKGTSVLNPHYFGKIERTKLDNDKIKIGVLGNVYNANKIALALYNLSKKERDKLEIYHIGKTEKRNLPIWAKKIEYHILSMFSKKFKGRWLRYSVVETGRLNFPEMYRKINEMDYLLAQIDTGNEEGKHYIEVSTSGSKQISLGMCKPLIISEDVGRIYGFNDKNAIFYQNNQLENAFRKIIKNEINNEDLIKNLQVLKDRSTNESLINLEKVIKRIES